MDVVKFSFCQKNTFYHNTEVYKMPGIESQEKKKKQSKAKQNKNKHHFAFEQKIQEKFTKSKIM